QVGTVGGGGVRLVAHRPGRPGAGPPGAFPGDADLVHQRDELRTVAVLAGGEDIGDRAAPPVGDQVNLGGQPAPGPAQSLPARPGARVLVIRRRPPWPVPPARRGGRPPPRRAPPPPAEPRSPRSPPPPPHLPPRPPPSPPRRRRPLLPRPPPPDTRECPPTPAPRPQPPRGGPRPGHPARVRKNPPWIPIRWPFPRCPCRGCAGISGPSRSHSS